MMMQMFAEDARLIKAVQNAQFKDSRDESENSGILLGRHSAMEKDQENEKVQTHVELKQEPEDWLTKKIEAHVDIVRARRPPEIFANSLEERLISHIEKKKIASVALQKLPQKIALKTSTVLSSTGGEMRWNEAEEEAVAESVAEAIAELPSTTAMEREYEEEQRETRKLREKEKEKKATKIAEAQLHLNAATLLSGKVRE